MSEYNMLRFVFPNSTKQAKHVLFQTPKGPRI
jgi:hypothetical protein